MTEENNKFDKYHPGVKLRKGDIYIGKKGSGVIEYTTHFMGCFIHYKPFDKEHDLNYHGEEIGLNQVDMHSKEGEFLSDSNAVVLREVDGGLEVIALSKDMIEKFKEEVK